MYVILIFLVSVLFQDLTFFQDSDMSSYVGFHCFKISSLFEDLASMKNTLSISVGLNSQACNGQDLVCSHMNHFAEESPNHNTTTAHTGTLSLKSQVCSAHTIHRIKDKDYYVFHDVINPVFFHLISWALKTKKIGQKRASQFKRTANSRCG